MKKQIKTPEDFGYIFGGVYMFLWHLNQNIM